MTSNILDDSTQLDEIDTNATGSKIKFLVQNAGFSQPELAKILRRDIKTISNYYCGKSLPDKNDLIILSRILGKSYEDLLVYKGDLEGYQRIDQYLLEYDEKNETSLEAINRSKTESKLFDPHTKGHCNIRNLEEAGYCLDFFHDLIQVDIRNRMMDALFSGEGAHGIYMQHIFEIYIWRKLSDEQKVDCKARFTILRGEGQSKDVN